MNNLHLLFLKPFFGAITGFAGTFLTWLGVLTPAIGFLTVSVGLVAAIYSLIHKRKQVLKDERELNGKP
jgi:heme O synthase-like polyprenyltransferase